MSENKKSRLNPLFYPFSLFFGVVGLLYMARAWASEGLIECTDKYGFLHAVVHSSDKLPGAILLVLCVCFFVGCIVWGLRPLFDSVRNKKHQAYEAIFKDAVRRRKSVQITLSKGKGGVKAASFLADCCKVKIVCRPTTVEQLISTQTVGKWTDPEHRTFAFSVVVGADQLTAQQLAEGIGLGNIESLVLFE